MFIRQMISLDALAHRYGCLPSEALSRATTLDLTVLHIGNERQYYNSLDGDEATKKQKYQAEKKVQALSQADMDAMIAHAAEKQNANKARHIDTKTGKDSR